MTFHVFTGVLLRVEVGWRCWVGGGRDYGEDELGEEHLRAPLREPLRDVPASGGGVTHFKSL